MLDMSGYLCFCRQKNFMTDTGMKVTVSELYRVYSSSVVLNLLFLFCLDV